MKQSPIAMIKCKFSNEIHDILNSMLTEDEKKLTPYMKYWNRTYKTSSMTDKEKLNLLDQIIKSYEETTTLIGNYRNKKKHKKNVHKARIARGWKPKKKTSKEDYLKSNPVA